MHLLVPKENSVINPVSVFETGKTLNLFSDRDRGNVRSKDRD